jgi:TonB family protein
VSQRTATALLAVLTLAVTVGTIQVAGQQAQQQAQNDEIVRRAKSRVQPAYPDLARRMNISGTVKIEVVVTPAGTVKDARVVGGHPVLAGAALEAARKWRFEAAAGEASGIIEFKFEPR